MDYVIKTVLSEYTAELEAYYSLLMVRLMNLCVKANPYSLLPVVVETDEQDFAFEDVADVCIPDEDHLDCYPKLEENIFCLARGVLDAHPEFKMSQESFKHGEDDIHYLRFTMPEVNENRRDVLLDGVDIFYKECKVRLEETKIKHQPRLLEKTLKLSKEDAEAAKDQFEESFKAVASMCEDLINDKHQEIEEAYQRYLQNQKDAGKAVQEQQAAEGEDVKSQLKMPSFDE